jgi:Domain of unknown function (DUF4167)
MKNVNRVDRTKRVSGGRIHPRRSEAAGTQTRNAQNPQQAYERYVILARAKTLAGEDIEAQNYYQHAEHYLRSMNATAINEN